MAGRGVVGKVAGKMLLFSLIENSFFFSFASKHTSPLIIHLNSVCTCAVSDSLQTASSMKTKTMSVL